MGTKPELLHPRTKFLYRQPKIHGSKEGPLQPLGHYVMVQVATHRPVPAVAYVLFQNSPRGIRGGQKGHRFRFLSSTTFFPVGIIAPVLHTHSSNTDGT